MNKIFILIDNIHHRYPNTTGAVSNEEVAKKFVQNSEKFTSGFSKHRGYIITYLDDPELLNRIAKEGK